LDIVSQHHERIDGSGYPKALTGDLITPEAKIFAVADVVEAMAAHRPYRPSLGIEAALREIEKNRGVLFDPEVVDSCLRLFREKAFAFTELANFYSGSTK
jgi:HD-GYP domain-containing protein (c-di-GMP phosphodiesterase class II)